MSLVEWWLSTARTLAEEVKSLVMFSCADVLDTVGGVVSQIDARAKVGWVLLVGSVSVARELCLNLPDCVIRISN